MHMHSSDLTLQCCDAATRCYANSASQTKQGCGCGSGKLTWSRTATKHVLPISSSHAVPCSLPQRLCALHRQALVCRGLGTQVLGLLAPHS